MNNARRQRLSMKASANLVIQFEGEVMEILFPHAHRQTSTAIQWLTRLGREGIRNRMYDFIAEDWMWRCSPLGRP